MNAYLFVNRLTTQLIRRFVSLSPLLTHIVLLDHAQAFTIVPTFDASITSDPQVSQIEATINSAIAVYEASFSDSITVYIYFQESEDISLGASTSVNQGNSYPDYRSALVSHATTEDDATVLAHLPIQSGNPLNNNQMILNAPLARALGLRSATTGVSDGTIFLKTSIMNLSTTNDPDKYSLFSVVSHEIDEVLGLGSVLNHLTNGAAPPTFGAEPEDLFRYDQNGARSFTSDLNALAYFSFDGSTHLARFNQSQNGDFGDWYSPGGQTPQVQDAFATSGATPVLVVELRVLDAIGFTRIPSPVWVDFQFGGSPELGTYVNPFKTLTEGINAVPAGGTILTKPGSTSERMKISKPMTVKAVGGVATVGL